jgi:DNA polymerase V
LTVFIYTNPHKKDKPCVHLSKTVEMTTATEDESSLIPLTSKILKLIYEPGHSFYKGGIVLGNLSKNYRQLDLFSINRDSQPKSEKYNKSNPIQSINRRFKESVKYASEVGNDRWQSRAGFRSNRYTTSWNELLLV